MSSECQLVKVRRQAGDIDRFLRLSYTVYEHDPSWVAPLLVDLKQLLSDRNPFFQHAEMELWMVTQEGRDVGRIAGILDQAHNRYQNDQAAFFGFYEAMPDPQISHLLFTAVLDWARSKGLRHILGPMNPNTNNECGLLVDGFEAPPVFMMTYNPPYYQHLVTAAGFQKAKDLLAFFFDLDHSPQERLERISAIFGQRQQDLKVRLVRKNTLERDLSKIKEIYNAAWQDNWGFVPLTDAEVQFMAERLKPLLREGLVWLAETPEEPAAFLLAVPDINQVIKPLRGRLLTPKIVPVLPYLLGWKQPAQVRVVALGVKKKYRGRGIESVMFAEGLKHAMRMGLRSCEASWILEDNSGVQRLIDLFGGKPYKTYRIYERAL
jgi:GNAT superfamily N-acetyltransferase